MLFLGMNDKFISRIFYILCIAHPFCVCVAMIG